MEVAPGATIEQLVERERRRLKDRYDCARGSGLMADHG
jgi:hypothetical protein